MKILIVDDAMFLRAILKNMLEKNNYIVIGEAVDGKEAVKKYFKLKPDVVTMDITMPRLNGLDAMKQILKKDPKAKILMCSAMGRNDFQIEAVKHGAIGFITKPFNEEQIISQLDSIAK